MRLWVCVTCRGKLVCPCGYDIMGGCIKPRQPGGSPGGEGRGDSVLQGNWCLSVSLTDLHSPSEACTPEDLLIWT